MTLPTPGPDEQQRAAYEAGFRAAQQQQYAQFQAWSAQQGRPAAPVPSGLPGAQGAPTGLGVTGLVLGILALLSIPSPFILIGAPVVLGLAALGFAIPAVVIARRRRVRCIPAGVGLILGAIPVLWFMFAL
ncbi:hypothetical protein [Microbacterium gilvum]|uniref:DUF4190 domain-containing protein n=1 Tax=Microbacterium gilvum TaxID=1336204 RepID=A0ABP8ZR95_9MICO